MEKSNCFNCGKFEEGEYVAVRGGGYVFNGYRCYPTLLKVSPALNSEPESDTKN